MYTKEQKECALKDLLGGTIQEMMEAELDEHLGYDEGRKEVLSITVGKMRVQNIGLVC